MAGDAVPSSASVRGVGADCLGLVRGVWRELYGCDAERRRPTAATGRKPAGSRPCSLRRRVISNLSRRPTPAPATSLSSGCAPARWPSMRRYSPARRLLLTPWKVPRRARWVCRRGGGGASLALSYPGRRWSDGYARTRRRRCRRRRCRAADRFYPARRHDHRGNHRLATRRHRRFDGRPGGAPRLGQGEALEGRGCQNCTSRRRRKAQPSCASTAAFASAGR